jgi:hypothetical protein
MAFKIWKERYGGFGYFNKNLASQLLTALFPEEQVSGNRKLFR